MYWNGSCVKILHQIMKFEALLDFFDSPFFICLLNREGSAYSAGWDIGPVPAL